MQFGLEEQTAEIIKEVLTSFPKIESVYRYGSRAKGGYQQGSDIDPTLIAPELSLSGLFRIENQLDDLLLQWNSDLVLFLQISNPDLICQIRRVGILLYKKEG